MRIENRRCVQVTGEHVLVGTYTPTVNTAIYPGFEIGKTLHVYQALEACSAQPVGRPPLFVTKNSCDSIPPLAYIFADEYGYLGFVEQEKLYPLNMIAT